MRRRKAIPIGLWYLPTENKRFYYLRTCFGIGPRSAARVKSGSRLSPAFFAFLRDEVHPDSHIIPLRHGTLGISIGFYGMEPLYDYRGKPDIFGRLLVFSGSYLEKHRKQNAFHADFTKLSYVAEAEGFEPSRGFLP